MFWITLAASVATMVLFTLLIVWLIRRQIRAAGSATNNSIQAYQTLCNTFGAETTAANQAQVRMGRSVFTFRYKPPHKNNPAWLTVGCSSPVGIGVMPTAHANPFRERPGGPIDLDYVRPVLLRSETRQDRLGKALFINREAQTGDEAFDDRVYIETDAPSSLVEALLGRDDVRSRVLRWLEEGWSAVSFFEVSDTIVLSATPAGKAHFDPRRMQTVFQEMDWLRAQLPKVAHRNLRRPQWSVGGWMTFTSVILLILGWVLAFVAGNIWSPVEQHPYLIALAAGLALWVASVPALGLLLRGRSDSWRALVTNVILLLVGLPPFILGLAFTFNGALDFAEPSEQRVQVVSLWASSGKSTSYYVKLRHWEPDEDPVHFRVSNEAYQRLRSAGGAGSTATMVVHPGLLGWSWWEEIRPSP